MSNLWEAAPVVEPQKQGAPPASQGNWWEAAPIAGQPAPAPSQDKSYSGSILPFSVDANGQAHFDTDAGIIGAVKRAIMLPREVYDGKVDLNSDEATGRVLEAATVINPANPAITAGDRAIPGPLRAVKKQRVEPPTAEALKKAASEGYDSVRDMGVQYSSDAVRDLAGNIRTGLEMDGVLGELAPKSFRVLEKLENPPEGSTAPLSGLIAARRSFGHAGRDFNNPTDQLAAGRAQRGLDTFIEGSDPSSVVAGPAAEAARAYQTANGNYAAAMRSDKLNGIEDAAELRAAAANSGQNLDNSIRQRIASLLLKPKEVAGFSEGEVAQLEKVVRGTATSNTARAVGNLLGGGGGLGAQTSAAIGAATGALVGGPAGAAIGATATPLMGYGSKKLANALTNRAFNKADNMTRMRSPLYEKMLEEAPMTAISPERRAALVRALMLTEQAKQPQE